MVRVSCRSVCSTFFFFLLVPPKPSSFVKISISTIISTFPLFQCFLFPLLFLFSQLRHPPRHPPLTITPHRKARKPAQHGNFHCLSHRIQRDLCLCVGVSQFISFLFFSFLFFSFLFFSFLFFSFLFFSFSFSFFFFLFFCFLTLLPSN